MDYLKGRDSNSRLQRSINKYGISNFEFVIYYFDIDPSVILTEIETVFIKSFPFENLCCICEWKFCPLLHLRMELCLLPWCPVALVPGALYQGRSAPARAVRNSKGGAQVLP
jgi:hypothetical protein